MGLPSPYCCQMASNASAALRGSNPTRCEEDEEDEDEEDDEDLEEEEVEEEEEEDAGSSLMPSASSKKSSSSCVAPKEEKGVKGKHVRYDTRSLGSAHGNTKCIQYKQPLRRAKGKETSGDRTCCLAEHIRARRRHACGYLPSLV